MISKKYMAAYLAGFFDGEGSLIASRYKRKSGSFRFSLKMIVYNTNFSVLEEIQKYFGGNVFVVKRKNQNPRWKTGGMLVWTEEKIISVLEEIYPYLICKREQAEIVLALQKTKMSANEGRKNGLSSKIINFRESGMQRLKKLNARGPNAIGNEKTG